MKPARHLISMLLVCSGLVLVQGVSDATTTAESPSTASKAAKADRSLADRLRDEARGSVRLSREPATKRVGFVSAGRNGDLLPSSNARATDKARAFLDTYGPLLGATDPSQLKQVGHDTDRYGTTVTYTQNYRGVPVFGAMLRAHLDRAGHLTSVNGTAVPSIDLSTSPTLSASRAATMAMAAVRTSPPTDDEGHAGSTEGIKAVSTKLIVYRTGLTFGRTGDTQLAYAVEVSNGANVRDMLFLNAGSGKLLNRYSMVDNAMERHVYEQSYAPASQVWQEGDAFPGNLNQDQQNIVRASGEAYWFFRNSFGRDSYDGAGAPQRTVNNDPRISCPNANWNGTTTNYCNGVTSDDVVAHEWGHAYTEYTDGLIYQWQPGALNESYSDIWGETVDLVNGRMDGDEGDITAKRPDGLCSTHSPLPTVVDINSPADIAKVCEAGAAAFGPKLDTTGVTGDVVFGRDGVGPSETDACTALVNPDEVAGKIALVDRGACAFTVKVKNAQNAGAIAVIVGDNVEATPTSMSGTDATITIPSVRIRLSDRNRIAGAFPQTVNVTMHQNASNRADSYRWLIGEDSTAFGGAIRDMWNPNCYGHPGKVSDAQYNCTTGDSGGVHSNSGVPNHGYAFLVDGGTYNGFTLDGIGLTKAAHIYWRAQTEYQTPTTDFADHADALVTSCNDLVGQQVPGLSTAGAPEKPAGEDQPTQPATIDATDCAQVEAMTNAVELRKAPTQCNFQPLLAKNAPAPCASTQKENTVWSEDFESGLGGWTVASQSVFGGPTFPWAADSTLPGSRSGTAAYGEDADGGNCDQSTDDHSGVTTMTGPAIDLPGAKQKAPKVTFQHYVASETGWDGGNVKLSINGGGFTVIPAAAYTYNKPTTITLAGNTNPLAGQPGFTGTDGGSVTGSWGESQIDLSMVGAKPGDTIRLRFDMGQDGCTGIDGWYVDDIKVLTCKSKPNLAVSPSSPTSAYGQARRLVVTVTPQDGDVTPTGAVSVSEDGTELASAMLARDGTAKMFLPAKLPAGAHDLTVAYEGDEATGSGSMTFLARVTRAISSSTLTMSPNPVVKGKTIKGIAETKALGVTPDGEVVLVYGGLEIGRGTLNNGKTTITLTRTFNVGKRSIRADYLGTDNVAPSTVRTILKVVRR